ncbi:MAG: 2-octaprenyl-6-methoxyphenyl hydroxylase, partial [Gammaproteobacteria bacterium]
MVIDSPQAQYDIVVVGGGLVGASFACAVARDDLSVLVVEAVAPGDRPEQPSFDARSTALSFGSRQIFAAMGLWPHLAAELTPIRRILVSDQGHIGGVELDHQELDQDALGYVAENRVL